MRQHIERFWKGWGSDVRRNPPCWPTKNTLYRAGYLTGHGGFGPTVPRIEYSCQDYYRAQHIWRQMPEALQTFTFVFYAQPWGWQRKCNELGFSKNRLYRMRDRVHDFTEARL